MDICRRGSSPGQVQEQIIDNLRRDQGALRQTLEMERSRHQQELNRLLSDLKGQQRENQQLAKTVSHQEVKIHELEQELLVVRELLVEERRGSQTEEVLNARALKELSCKLRQEEENSCKLSRESELLRLQVEKLNESLTLERKATESLIHEHNAEVKALREEVHARAFEANKELQIRAVKEKEEYRAIREESEKTYKIIEQDFRTVIAHKDEELKQTRSELKALQRELEEQRRISFTVSDYAAQPNKGAMNDTQQTILVRSLRQEVGLLKNQIKKMEKHLQNTGDAIFSEVQRERSKYEKVLVDDDKKIRADVTKLIVNSPAKVPSDQKRTKSLSQRSGSNSNARKSQSNSSRRLSYSHYQRPDLGHSNRMKDANKGELKKTMLILRELLHVK